MLRLIMKTDVTITDIDAAWLAGLLEGEGSFLFPSPSCYPSQVGVSLQMTDEDVVARVGRLIGATYRRSIPPNPAWSPTFIIQVRGRRALSVMQAILPFMGERRTARIRALMQHIVHLPKGAAPKVTPEIREFIIRECAAGRSARSVARELKVNHNTICRVLNRV